MKQINIIQLAAATALILTSNVVNAGKIYGLGDIKDRENLRNRTHNQVHGQKLSQTELDETFTGTGHKVGGSPYANRLLGIGEEEGRRLYKAAKKARKAQKSHKAKNKSKSKKGNITQASTYSFLNFLLNGKGHTYIISPQQKKIGRG